MSSRRIRSSGPETTGARASLRRLQMADIARMAKVSTATVSRALNGSPLVTADTRERIQELARSLNYTINAGAKNLRTGLNRTVAVVVPYDPVSRQSVSDPFFLSLLGSIADALTEQGYELLVARVDARQLDAAANFFDTGRVIGIVLIGQWRHHDQLNAMAARGVPIVVWGAQMPQQLYCAIGCDNVAGGLLATEHLLDCGRRRIAFFGDIRLPEVAHRHEGYRRALQQRGIAFDKALCVTASFLADGARHAVDELQRRKIPFDAVFACSDLLAMTTISILQEQHLRVPRDLSVVGYDDIELATYFHPKLTTVRQPIDLGGRELVAALLELVEHKRAPPRVLATELVIRETSRHAPQRSAARLPGRHGRARKL